MDCYKIQGVLRHDPYSQFLITQINWSILDPELWVDMFELENFKIELNLSPEA